MQKDTRTGKITIFYKGENYSLTDLAKRHNVVPSTLRNRLNKGFSVEDALKPKGKNRGKVNVGK